MTAGSCARRPLPSMNTCATGPLRCSRWAFGAMPPRRANQSWEHPALLNARQIKIEEAGGYADERKALSRLRACSLLCEPLSDRIGRQWRFSNAIGTRILARYGRSACSRGVYPSHLAASFSTVPSPWSFLMASLMALVSSGLSLFTATAYSSPVATSTTTWASL